VFIDFIVSLISWKRQHITRCRRLCCLLWQLQAIVIVGVGDYVYNERRAGIKACDIQFERVRFERHCIVGQQFFFDDTRLARCEYFAARHVQPDFSILKNRFKPVLVTGFFSFPHHRQFVDIVCSANLFFRGHANDRLAALP
jgi:hypothetical protein